MTYENELPLPDYDGGPADRAREAAALARRERDAQAALEKANLRVHLGYIVANNDDVNRITNFLYDMGYRKAF